MNLLGLRNDTNREIINDLKFSEYQHLICDSHKLFKSIKRGQLKNVKYYLSRMNLTYVENLVQYSTHYNPLAWAVMNNRTEIVKYLVYVYGFSWKNTERFNRCILYEMVPLKTYCYLVENYLEDIYYYEMSEYSPLDFALNTREYERIRSLVLSLKGPIHKHFKLENINYMIPLNILELFGQVDPEWINSHEVKMYYMNHISSQKDLISIHQYLVNNGNIWNDKDFILMIHTGRWDTFENFDIYLDLMLENTKNAYELLNSLKINLEKTLKMMLYNPWRKSGYKRMLKKINECLGQIYFQKFREVFPEFLCREIVDFL